MEQDFLYEHANTMRPFAKAINILQSEHYSFMGFLLPTLYELLHKLEKMKHNLRYCVPLVVAISDGIRLRFENMLNDCEIIRAAILLPKFKTDWTVHGDTIPKRYIGYILH